MFQVLSLNTHVTSLYKMFRSVDISRTTIRGVIYASKGPNHVKVLRKQKCFGNQAYDFFDLIGRMVSKTLLLAKHLCFQNHLHMIMPYIYTKAISLKTCILYTLHMLPVPIDVRCNSRLALIYTICLGLKVLVTRP